MNSAVESGAVVRGGAGRLSHRRVWALAGPMIVSNISVPLVGAVDTAVVGHLPQAHHIGAVALGALIFTFLYWGFGFLRMATTGIVARAVGAGDARALSNTLLRTLLLALLFGAAVIALSRPLIALALLLLDSSAQVERLAGEYARIRVWSAPAALCVYVFTGLFIGMHNTRAALGLVLILNLTNMALDFLFVPVLGFGVAGVAWATLIAEYTALIAGAWMLRADIRRALMSTRRAEVLESAAVLELMRANGHIFARTLCLMFSFAWFTAQSARLGEVALAANAILLHLQSIMAYALDGFAHAAEALAGSAYGARRRAAFRRAVRLTTLWAAVCAGLVSVAYLAFGEALLGLFTGIDTVLQTSARYLPWMAAMPLLSVWSFQLDGIFIGTGHTRAMRDAMLLSTAAYLALVALLLPWLGNHGLFLGLAAFMLIRALTLWRYYPGVCAAMETVDGDGG
ncbi:MAG: MATE family efflux transporter [Gammaproteobacteria bacterium]|nr:MATE family efflux transporter [Gammaproteobacteria bacterium]